MSTATESHSGSFLRRLTLATGGGMFLDGFVFAAMAVSLAGGAIKSDLHLVDPSTGNISGTGSIWLSLIAVATQIGTMIGGLVIGYFTDLWGRRVMFIADLAMFLGASGFMFFAREPWEVFILGIVWGIAVGGDYAIGSPLLGEFVPAAKRGHYLGLLEVLWNVGYVTSFLAGYKVLTTWPDLWHIVLALPVIPALIILALRHGLPESPRWLASKGRTKEAQEIVEGMPSESDPINLELEAEQKTSWRRMFSRDYIARTIFCAVFWSGIVLPYFALQFFQADVLKTIGLADPLTTALIGTCVALIGAGIGWSLIDRVGRRKLLLIPMFTSGVFLTLVALEGPLDLPVSVTIVCFFGYLLFYGVMSILPGVYPIEVMPTSERASGTGLAAAFSRLSAIIGTFFLPISLRNWGLTPTLLMLAAVSFLAWGISFRLAPETCNKDLTTTGAEQEPDRRMPQEVTLT